MPSRAVLSAVSLVAAVVVLGVGAVLWLSRDAGGDAEDDPVREKPTATEDAPTIIHQTDRERTQIRHDLPWPYGDFADDIAELRRPIRRNVVFEKDRIERDLGRQFNEVKLSLDLENVRVDDVVAELTRHFAPLGLNVYTRDPPVENDPVFEKFVVQDADVWTIITQLAERTGRRTTFAMTPAGLCIGSIKACFNARADGQKWVDEQVGEGAPDEEFAFLEGEYRPDFSGAHIGYVVADVKAQCGVEVVVGPEVWSAPVNLTWRSDPMPVLAALRQIALKCGAALYAKDGRVFLLDR